MNIRSMPWNAFVHRLDQDFVLSSKSFREWTENLYPLYWTLRGRLISQCCITLDSELNTQPTGLFQPHLRQQMERPETGTLLSIWVLGRLNILHTSGWNYLKMCDKTVNMDVFNFISIALFHVKHAQLRWAIPMHKTHTQECQLFFG